MTKKIPVISEAPDTGFRARKVRSCLPWWIVPWGMVGWVASFLAFGHYRDIAGLGEEATCLLVILICGCWTGLAEWIRNGWPTPRRAADGSRLAFKFVGLAATLGGVAFLYWLFPIYQYAYYSPFFKAVHGLAGIGALLIMVAYVIYTDLCMDNPHDAYWHLGRALVMRWDSADRAVLRTHFLGWLVKGFFLPLMFVQGLKGMRYIWGILLDLPNTNAYIPWHNFIFETMMTAEVCAACGGYIFALQIFRSHIRSVEPTLLGWAVALCCYAPFFDGVFKPYLDYHDALVWSNWLEPWPQARIIWGIGILFLVVAYGISTFAFGIRFSNLTHRGIVTNNTYALTKHPAFVSKNLFWWMISVPFVVNGDPEQALRHSLLLLAVNMIYVMRAYTEERHLSRDDDYVRYALWMDRHSIFSFISRLFPALSYARLHQQAVARVTSGETGPG